MTAKIKNPGIYQTLIAQLDKIARHNRQGSFRTKERYYEAMQRFCRFLADEYHLQKLANVSGKHLTAYVIHMQEQGKSASTIKTDLAAIRFFHDKLERAKYRLPSNDDLSVELERRRFGQVDRTWSEREFSLFLDACTQDGHEDFATVARLTWFAGLRIHECFRIDTAMAEQALREDAITVKGKGGKIRTVPINENIRDELKKFLDITPRGHKLFVPDDMPTHSAIAQLQMYIYKVRPLIQDDGSTRPMTHHGLRHSYAVRDLAGAEQERHESAQRQSEGVSALGPRKAGCHECIFGVSRKGGVLMDKKIQILYAKLTQEDRDKVDARIRELFAKQHDLLANERCSKVQWQENHC